MVGKGNLVVFEGSGISETGQAMPTKIGVHAFDINPYLRMNFLSRFYSIQYFHYHTLSCQISTICKRLNTLESKDKGEQFNETLRRL